MVKRYDALFFNWLAILIGGWVTVAPIAAFSQSSGSRNPNVIFILADDLGWADLGCYGHPFHETPNLDRLAQNGMRFTDAYAAAPICSASRAALLTGKSPAKLQFEFVTKADGSEKPSSTILEQPDYPRDLSLEEITLAELLSDTHKSGYFGKWHLTQENDAYLEWGNRYGPLQQGFQEGESHRGSHAYGYAKAGRDVLEDYGVGHYPVDSLTEYAISFIERNQAVPFLLYYAMYYVHTPVITKNKWLYEKYERKLGNGASAAAIHYAAYVETMDHYVGNLLKTIDDLGLSEETIIVFTSDNGGDPRFKSDHRLRSGKWTLFEYGIRVPTIVSWPAKISKGTVSHTPVNGYDWVPTLTALASPETETHVAGLDGIDLSPVLFGRPHRLDRRSLYWHFPFYHGPVVDSKPQAAIRKGKYKAIYYFEDDTITLFNLHVDPAEHNDLAKNRKNKAASMARQLLSELKRVGARLPVHREAHTVEINSQNR